MLELLVLFIISIALLAYASHTVINSSIKISEHFGVSEMAVGYLLIALSTSMPDFMVALNAAIAHDPGIVLGDVFGSTMANICLVLGAAALIKRIRVQREHMLESAEILLAVSILPLILLSRGVLTRIDGLVLLLIFGLYCVFIFRDRFSLKIKAQVSHLEWIHAIIGFFTGMLIVIATSKFVIVLGRSIAQDIDVPDILIGFTFIAFGTTLPELAVDFTAIRRGHTALAVGDILGSCIINLTLVLGTSALVTDLAGPSEVITLAVSFIVGTSIFLWYLLVKHEGISRTHGLIFIVLYIIFLLTVTFASLAA